MQATGKHARYGPFFRRDKRGSSPALPQLPSS
jgi:hypothetical protein